MRCGLPTQDPATDAMLTRTPRNIELRRGGCLADLPASVARPAGCDERQRVTSALPIPLLRDSDR